MTKDNDSLLEDGDGDFDPETQNKRRSRAKAKVPPGTDIARKETHTLDEHHDHLLSASYELSFSQAGPLDADGPSSSQAERPFENFFPFSDGFDLGDGLGDDLARELGWGVSPVKSVRSNRFAGFFYVSLSIPSMKYSCRNMDVDQLMIDFDERHEHGIDFNFCIEDVPMLEDVVAPFNPIICQSDAGTQHAKETPRKRKVSVALLDSSVKTHKYLSSFRLLVKVGS